MASRMRAWSQSIRWSIQSSWRSSLTLPCLAHCSLTPQLHSLDLTSARPISCIWFGWSQPNGNDRKPFALRYEFSLSYPRLFSHLCLQKQLALSLSVQLVCGVSPLAHQSGYRLWSWWVSCCTSMHHEWLPPSPAWTWTNLTAFCPPEAQIPILPFLLNVWLWTI